MRYSIPRKSRRVPLSTLVNLKLERLSGAVTEITSDLSLGGMFVPSDTPAEIGSLVAFEFNIGDDQVEGTGEVVWQRLEGDGPDQPPGMGIRFRYLSPGSRERIFRLVQRYANDGEDALPEPNSAPPAVRPDHDPTAARAESAPIPLGVELTEEVQAPPSLLEPEALAEGEETLPPAAELGQAEMFANAAELAQAAEPVEAFEPPAPVDSLDHLEAAAPELSPAQPVTVAASGAEDLPEVPAWLRPDPPDLPEVPMAPETDSISAAELANSFDSEGTEDTVVQTGTHWQKSRGAGVAGGGSRGFQLNWRTVILASLLGALALVALFRLSGPLLARFGGGEEQPASNTQVAATEEPAATQVVEPAADDPEPVAEPEEAEPEPVANSATEETEPTATPSPLDSPILPPSQAPALADATPADTPQEPPVAVADPAPSRPGQVAAVAPSRRSQPVGVAPSRPMERIGDIRVQQTGTSTLVIIEADGTIDQSRLETVRLADPPRELVKLAGVTRPYQASRVTATTNQVRGVRTGYHAGQALHVVLDLVSADVQPASVEVVGNQLRIRLQGP